MDMALLFQLSIFLTLSLWLLMILLPSGARLSASSVSVA